MNFLSLIIAFTKEKRKILISLFLTIGILSAIVDGIILVQRPQVYKSRAASPVDQIPPTAENITEFASSLGVYSLSYDARLWGAPQNLGRRAVFNLNWEYGFARVDIIEGESNKDLDTLVEEIIKESVPVKAEYVHFQGKPSYLLTYKEEVVGEDVFYYKQVVKENDKFLIFEKRAPDIGYSSSFVDNLLSGISFKNLEPPIVKGIANDSDDLTTVQLVDLVRPSIANIIYVYCLDIVNLSPDSRLSKSRYNFCNSSKGSGFIINEQGIVATNGHVVKVYPQEGLVANILHPSGEELSRDLIKSIYLSKGQTPTSARIEQFYQNLSLNPQYLDRFLTEIFGLIDKKLLAVTTSYEAYYVNAGNEPFEVDYQKINKADYTKAVIPSTTTYKAKLIDFNYPNKYSYEAIVNKNYHRGADVALLRIDTSTSLFPALELGSVDNLREGSEIVVAGYPTLVEGEKDPRAAISYKTSTKPTFSRGIISAVKKDLTDKIVLQTDASIDHGNSGGPAFNKSSQVIGIATFMEESKTGNFNFLRDISELKDLMAKNKIENTQGILTNDWRRGLAEYRDQYYNRAIKYFNRVKSQSASHPSVDEFINLSQEAVAKGESLEGLAGFIKGKNSGVLLVVFGGISTISFMSAGFLTLLPLFRKEETYVG